MAMLARGRRRPSAAERGKSAPFKGERGAHIRAVQREKAAKVAGPSRYTHPWLVNAV
jgi:hypothetical protein